MSWGATISFLVADQGRVARAISSEYHELPATVMWAPFAQDKMGAGGVVLVAREKTRSTRGSPMGIESMLYWARMLVVDELWVSMPVRLDHDQRR